MKALIILLLLGGVAAAQPVPAAPPPVSPQQQACFALLNSDPSFAKAIVEAGDRGIDAQTIKAHEDALHHVQKNESHVIYAYAAMWAIAALLLAFLFMRQQALKGEIATLRRDLAKAEGDA